MAKEKKTKSLAEIMSQRDLDLFFGEISAEQDAMLQKLFANIKANRAAIASSQFGWHGILKDVSKYIAYGKPYSPLASISTEERKRQFEMRRAASELPQYSRDFLPAVIRKPTNFFPYNKYDFVGKDKTRYDTNWAYNQAESTPSGLDFFAPVTGETARSMREEDEDARERKHNRYAYLRRQATRRQRIFDEYKWLKPIAKANPTIAKNLPKIAKRLDAISKIIPGGRMLTQHPALVAAGLAWGTVNRFFDIQSRLQQRRILEGYYGTPSEAMRNAMFATGIGYNAAAQKAGDFAALRSQLQHGEGLGAIMRAAKYGLTSVTAMMDPLLSDEQVLKIVSEEAKRMDVGERINSLSSVGISSEMYSAGLKIGMREEELPLEDFISLRSKQFENWLTGTSWGRTVDNFVGGMWLTPINKLFAVGEYMAQHAPYGGMPKSDSRIDNSIRRLFGIDKPLAEAAAKSLDANPMPLAEAAAKSLDANPMPLAEAAAKSLDASNARATDADVAAITNYNTTERPVTVVIQGDIRTDASNGEALYNDIEKTYGVDFLTGIAQPVANAFDSKRVR